VPPETEQPLWPELSGTVQGIGKYVIIPPITCDEAAELGKDPGETANCAPCDVAEDCVGEDGGDGYECIDPTSQGAQCAAKCLQSADCPDGYKCGYQAGAVDPVCTPDAGEPWVYCQATTAKPFDQAFQSTWAKADGTWSMTVFPGDKTIVCVGGIVRLPFDPWNTFTPLAMGVYRNIHAMPDTVIDGIDITLDIPRTRTVPVRLHDAPTEYVDPWTGIAEPTDVQLKVALDFGADGYLALETLEAAGLDRLDLPRQPTAFTGDLEGVTYHFQAEARGGEYAISRTHVWGVDLVQADRVATYQDGLWNVEAAGIYRDVHAMWGTGPQDVWAVGQGGLIAHRALGAWFPQFSPTKADLNGVWGADDGHALVVGDAGTALSFNAVVWTAEDTGTQADLNAVWGSSPNHAIAVGDHVALRRTEAGWQTLDGAPQTTLRGVWMSDSGVALAVGDDALLHRLEGDVWTASPLPTVAPLHAVHGTSLGNVWIAGDGGTVLRGPADGPLVGVATPTDERLLAITTTADGINYAVGERGVMLRWDGQGWDLEWAPEFGGDLAAVVGFAGPGQPAFAAGIQALDVGPMLTFPELMASEPGLSFFNDLVAWDAKPSVEPTMNMVKLLTGNGFYFPQWIMVGDGAETWVELPELQLQKGIDPIQADEALLEVTRIYEPGLSAETWEYWDIWYPLAWRSYARDAAVISTW